MTLLASFRLRGVRFERRGGGDLAVKGRGLTPELLAEVRQRKAEILALLDAPPPPPNRAAIRQAVQEVGAAYFYSPTVRDWIVVVPDRMVATFERGNHGTVYGLSELHRLPGDLPAELVRATHAAKTLMAGEVVDVEAADHEG